MTERKFTPGPWHQVDYAGQFEIQDGPMYEDNNILRYDSCLNSIFRTKSFSKEESEANAKLMCAAPELLDACLTAKAMYEAQGIDSNSRIGGEQYTELIKAIKKATE